MNHFFYESEQNDLKQIHSICLNEVLSTHLYDTGKGLALQIIMKEKVEDFEETKSNKGKPMGLRKINKNASIYITKLSDIRRFYDNMSTPKSLKEMLENATEIVLDNVNSEV